MENPIKAAVNASDQDTFSQTDAKTEGIGEVLSMEEIKRRYPQEWVLIAYKELNPDQSVKTGELLAHSPDCEEIENRLLGFQSQPLALAIEYTGPFVPDHAGVLM
ncbi:hypothetical protein [Oscillatoria acuminata]|uniref:Uncharacterized protein n=1 Tax=Oscillatoria acuminata PCC 6304 TaxID=56110 RepID=K9TQA9_9CYAN|nr:hypothetical protein [Oscillatoria acuminata]AFY84194.1 hypothetical protein Oscil6304_4682 [Oscillatoria acuminata PCC 6304]